MPGRPHVRLLDEGAQDHVAAVRPAVDRPVARPTTAAPGPSVRRRPGRGRPRGPTRRGWRGGTRGRSRSSRGSRRRGRRSPPGRAAGGTGVKPAIAPARSGRRADTRSSGRVGRRACRSPSSGRHSVALDAQAVAGGDDDPLPAATRPEDQRRRRGPPDASRSPGAVASPSGATPGTGSSHRSCGRVSLSPIAATHAPSGSQPTARHTPSHGEMSRAASPAATTVRGVFGGRPRPRLGGVPSAIVRTTRSMSPSWTSMWTKRSPSGDGSGGVADAPDGSPCSRSPSVRTSRSRPSGDRRTTWNQPLASDDVQERAVGQAVGSRRRGCARRRRPAARRSGRSTSATWSVSRSSGVRLGADHGQPGAVRRPRDAGRHRCRAR